MTKPKAKENGQGEGVSTPVAKGTETIEELADKAIENKIRRLDRMIETERKHIKDANILINGYLVNRNTLIGAQIDRLKAKLPQDLTAPAEETESQGV